METGILILKSELIEQENRLEIWKKEHPMFYFENGQPFLVQAFKNQKEHIYSIKRAIAALENTNLQINFFKQVIKSGCIVGSNNLSSLSISQAQACYRFYADKDGFGYVYFPDGFEKTDAGGQKIK